MRAGRPPADQDKERPAGAIVRVTFEFRLIIQFFGIGEKFFLEVVGIIPVRVKGCPRKITTGPGMNGEFLFIIIDMSWSDSD